MEIGFCRVQGIKCKDIPTHEASGSGPTIATMRPKAFVHPELDTHDNGYDESIPGRLMLRP